jgi:hypothetical protein
MNEVKIDFLDSELPEENTVVDFDEWSTDIVEKQELLVKAEDSLNQYSNQPSNRYKTAPKIVVGAGKYLSDVLAGYMTEPAAFYDGSTLLALTKYCTTIEEFKKIVESKNASGAKVFLYMAIWYPDYYIFNDEEPLTAPEYISGFWCVRYAVVEGV